MHIRDYMNKALQTAQYPDHGSNPVYPALGLVGEAGEVSEIVKKAWRKSECLHGGDYLNDKRDELKGELGDVLWYWTVLCWEAGIDPEDVARHNLAKLEARAASGTIKER